MVRLNTNKNTLQYTVGPCASSFMSELNFSTRGHYYFPSFTMALLNTLDVISQQRSCNKMPRLLLS